MKPLSKGLLLGVLHVALVLSLGAKLLVDRATLPRVWVKTYPFDPNLPIRGRYLALRVDIERHGTMERQSIAYFIPEHAPDPSQRMPGEELWAEVTLPKKGPPRPIRLGVKKEGRITPLELN